MMYKFNVKLKKIPFQSLLGAALLGCVVFGMFSGNTPHPDRIRFIGATVGVCLLCLSCWIKKDKQIKEKDKPVSPSPQA